MLKNYLIKRKIYENININFYENILSKNDLKILFASTYENTRKKVVGFTLYNIRDSVCYTLSSFNLLSRMQGVILNEIDNLVNISDVVEKIKRNECVNNIEANNFNKYLLIQTFIELHDNNILLKLKDKLLTPTIIIPKDDIISHLRINFIRKRLEQYVFPEEVFDVRDPFEDDIKKSNNEIKNIINEFFELTNYDTYFGNILSNVNTFDERLEWLVKSRGDIGQPNDNGYENILKDYKQLLTDIQQNIQKYYNSNIDITGIDLTNFDLSIISATATTESELKNYFELKKKEIDTISNHLITLIDKYLNNTITKADFTINHCNNIDLSKKSENLRFSVDMFGLTVGNVCPLGNTTLITIQALINILDSTHITEYDISGNISAYVIRKFGNLTTRLSDINTLNIPNYKIVGITLNCGNRHSISALCYGDDCITQNFTVLNDMTRNINQLIDSSGNVSITGNFGSLCSQNLNDIKIETILYEKNNVVSDMQTKINIDIKNIIITLFPKAGKIPIDFPTLHGGNINDIYYTKYLKYKEKYLNLKKLISK